MKNKKNGFTLVEILAVITVLGIVSILLIPTALDAFYKARGMVDEMEISDIEDAAKMWVQDRDLKVKSYVYNENTPYEADESTTYTKGQMMSAYHFKVYIINNPITITMADLVNEKYYDEDCEYGKAGDDSDDKNCTMSDKCQIKVGIKGELVQNGRYWSTLEYTAKASESCK